MKRYRAMHCPAFQTFEVIFVREPSLLPVFGKLGVKARVTTVAVPVRSESIASRLREFFVAHGGMLLKLAVVVWTVMILAAVFFMMQA
ncbi:MAG: hypothetical protein ABIQ51_06680 [Mesorhizobium sp.]